MSDVSRGFSPYCAQMLEDGTYILLGRERKPVGCIANGWANLEEYQIGYEVEGLTSKMAAEMSWNRDLNVECIYFYNDRTAPWRGKRESEAYDKRVARFLGLARLVVRFQRGATSLVD